MLRYCAGSGGVGSCMILRTKPGKSLPLKGTFKASSS
jgi:hypothetical protein